MNWRYKNKEVKNIPKDYDHFIYIITNIDTGQWYVGKKIFFNKKRVKLSKKRRLELNTRKIYEHIVKESDWKDYYGSSIELKNDILKRGKDKFKREILKYVKGKKQATAWELYYIFKSGFPDKLSYNGNILGRIFKKDFIE
jgi:hypothetical protein